MTRMHIVLTFHKNIHVIVMFTFDKNDHFRLLRSVYGLQNITQYLVKQSCIRYDGFLPPPPLPHPLYPSPKM